MIKALLLLLLPVQLFAQQFSNAEIKKWQIQASQVEIIRDNFGIPHIYGKTDADAVFGLLYAQCEDDFKRVEMNYIEKLGRLSEVKGTSEFYNDLLIRLLIDTTEAKADFNKAAPWLKTLLNAYADGINYYLYKNPQVKPALLKRFEPWYQLLWTDGSIGAISTAEITTDDLKKFYPAVNSDLSLSRKDPDQQTGSNGFAVAPSKTESGNAILYINPHVTFYFRPEVHVVSEQGLNVYGAVTWGQFFIYQGFNKDCGWMHTSAIVDVADMYLEKTSQKNSKYFYEYEKKWLPVKEKKITIRYRDGTALKSKTINTYYTQHGPVMAQRDGKWISLKSYNRSLTSLEQSWLRTKAKGFEDYKKVMNLRANTSNSTVFADRNGNIALWHGNYVPKRDKNLDWSNPVDGTKTATDWKGLHTLEEIVHVYNPATGYIQNCNSTPFTSSGSSSPKKENYPSYMAPDGENFRGINAARVLSKENKFTIDKIIAAGYDKKLSAFEVLIPAIIKAYDQQNKYDELKEVMEVLKAWDYNTSETSVATTLSVQWAEKLNKEIQHVYISAGEADQVQKTKQFAATATADQLLKPMVETVNEIKNRFGKWQMPWGEVNRFQRRTGNLQQEYNDKEPSIPVAFTSATWGQLPSYNSRSYPSTNKRYGVSGNSFVCAVEFGKTIKAKSLLAGGVSGNPASKHFNDQAMMYAKGEFKDVLFYKEDVLKHVERRYHPGE